MRQEYNHTRTSRLGIKKALVALTMLFGIVSARDRLKLRGTRYIDRPEYFTSRDVEKNVSLMGGARLAVDGPGFHADPAANKFVLKGKFKGVRNREFENPALDENDEFSSKPPEGTLALTLAPATNVLRASFGELIDEDAYFQISVKNTEANTETKSAKGIENVIQYRKSATPMYYDMIPNQVHRGQRIQYMINPQGANHNKPAHELPIQELSLSSILTNWQDTIDSDTTLPGWKLSDPLTTIVGNHPPTQNAIPRALFRVGDSYIMNTAKHCNFKGDDCWYVRVHPVIDSLNYSAGSIRGGQELKIKGFGFEGKAEVFVDGVKCDVRRNSESEIVCMTGEAQSTSKGGYQPGSPGLIQTKVEPTDEDRKPDWTDRTNNRYERTESHLTTFETHVNELHKDAYIVDGFFKAPAAGRYRFHLSANEQAILFLDENAYNPATQSAAPSFVASDAIAQRNRASSWRDFFSEYPFTTSASQWITLEKDQFYPVQAYLREDRGQDHMSVAVEFETTETQGHHHAGREIQLLTMEFTGKTEEWELKIEQDGQLDSGTFELLLLDPQNKGKKWISDPIRVNAKPEEIRSRLAPYYKKVWESAIAVEETEYELVNGIVKRTFRIKMLEPIEGVSFDYSQIYSLKSASSTTSVTVRKPSEVQPSDDPLDAQGGKYMIACPDLIDPEVIYRTPELEVNSYAATIDDRLQRSIPWMPFKVRVSTPNKASERFPSDKNGLQIAIYMQDFEGWPGAIPQCRIEGDHHQYHHENPIRASKVAYSAEKIQERGTNLWFEPVPLEMLYTPAEKPQVLVTVDGIPAVCPARNCDYSYIEGGSGKVTDVQLQGATLKIEAEGLVQQECDDQSSDKIRVDFADTNCEISTNDKQAGRIECKLDHPPVAGRHHGKVSGICGNFDYKSTSPIDVPLIVESVTPSENLSSLGGDLLIIKGSGFSALQAPEVALDDGTVCRVRSFTSTEIKCITGRLDQSGEKSTYGLAVNVNGIQQSSDVNLSVGAQLADSIAPQSLSPVLPGTLTIQLSQDYQSDPNDASVAMTVDEFAAELSLASQQTQGHWVFDYGKGDFDWVPDATTAWPIYVRSVDNAAKTVTLKFRGAPSGDYHVFLKSSTRGRLDTENLKIKTQAVVTGISPKRGSALGGTTVTITGENFSDNALDNPVWIGDSDCLVQSTSATEIVCKIEHRDAITDFSDYPKEGPVSVFLRLGETAACGTDSCTFTFEEPKAEVTSIRLATKDDPIMTKDIKNVKYQPVIHVEGSGFAATSSTVKMTIDGVELQVLSVDDDIIKFVLVEVLDRTTRDIELYFDDGLPKGYDTVLTQLWFGQQVYSIGPAVGSAGGTLLTIKTAAGIGANTDVSGWRLEARIKKQWTPICDDITFVTYGTLTCTTYAMEVPLSNLRVKLSGGGKIYCANEADWAGNCRFQQLGTAMTPVVTKATIYGDPTNKIKFEGSGFQSQVQAGSTPYGEYRGLEAAVFEYNSDQEVIVEFKSGVPVLVEKVDFKDCDKKDTKCMPRLLFKHGSETVVAAYDGAFAVTGPADLALKELPSGLKCSFAGGCDYTIVSPGLKSSLSGIDNSSIEVCGNTCIFDAEQSDAGQSTCHLEPLVTRYSVATYGLAKPDILKGTWDEGSNAGQLENLNDGVLTIDYEDNSSQCFFKFQDARENYMYSISEVRFFINGLSKTMPHVDNLIFQGSQDGNTWDDYWTIDSSLHKGWNSKDFADVRVKSFRFVGSAKGACEVGEVEVKGIEMYDSTNSEVECAPTLTIGGESMTLDDGKVTYSASVTPVLDSINKRYGSVRGGDELVLDGSGFGEATMGRFLDDPEPTATVLIDGRRCEISSQTDTQIICTTGDRPHSDEDSSLQISVQGRGNTATKGKLFRYVYRWSETTTWGGFAPGTGDAVNIPKGMHLLVDVPKTPVLSFVNVEGSLIFDQEKTGTFDAEFIIVKGGYLEIGTEAEPYTGKLVITMHGAEFGRTLPLFGNKVLAVKGGQLEMHGAQRDITWTDLLTTAEAGAKSIELNDIEAGDEFDWTVGEQIVIASTDFEGTHAETRTISAIRDGDKRNPIIEFEEGLEYKHYAGEEQYGGQTLEMRAEVGLLSRNVVFRGNVETTPQYGAHIMLAPGASGSVSGKIENIELTDVGQAFKLGRYPIHFHLSGNVNGSYIKNNAIHNSFNRGLTVHGVNNLVLYNNVIYKEMGHGIFIEDGVETGNLIERNLVIDTRESWSLLVTDQTPASFWIQHPDNIFRGNHAAGSAKYGFHFDLPEHPTGPSIDENICPINAKLGEFTNNAAHSNGRYGLRVHHGLEPRKYPCRELDYETNPPIPAVFSDFVGYKNKRNGMISEKLGAVQFHNFKTADNWLAGMEVARTGGIEDGYAKIVGGLVVGRSANHEDVLDQQKPHGIITPRSENFTIEKVEFVNFEIGEGEAWGAALGTCSHCFHGAATDSGARTVTVSGLKFDSSVQKRISYQYPYRAIFYDADGSLTGGRPRSWATPYWKHNDQPECSVDTEVYDGIVCPPDVQIRRVAFHGYKPDSFRLMDLRITQLDRAEEEALANQGTRESYLDDKANYSLVPFKLKQDPFNGHAMPFVTGHRYHIHWQSGLDFTKMRVEVSERWEETDLDTYFVTNYTDYREAIRITRDYSRDWDADGIPAMDLDAYLEGGLSSGDSAFNGNYGKEFEFVINGKNPENNELLFQGLRCKTGTCPEPVLNDGILLEEKVRPWSDPTSWGGVLPKAGDDVEIEATWNMLLDIPDPPALNSLTINGRLTFDDKDITLQAHTIWVQSGQLYIGTKDKPFEHEAKIVLLGHTEDATVVTDGDIAAGNKVLVNTGTVKMYGKSRDRQSRLRAVVQPGDTTAKVASGLDWKQGDKLYFAPTAMQATHSDYLTIKSYTKSTGDLELDGLFQFYHWGKDQAPTESEHNGVDMRGEVLLLTRNVQVEGEDVDAWGCSILTTEIRARDSNKFLAGALLWDNVEVSNCSQRDSERAAVRFEGATTGPSEINNSVVHGGLAWLLLISSSKNIDVNNSSFIGARAVGVNLKSITNVHLDGVFVGDVQRRDYVSSLDGAVDKEGCVAFCSYWQGNQCRGSSIRNSVAAGCPYGGFVAPGHDCGDYNDKKFYKNTAHSVDGSGAYIYPDPAVAEHSACYEGSHFVAYKNQEQGVATQYVTQDLRMRHMTLIDNQMGGINLNGNGDTDSQKISAKDMSIYGEGDQMGDDCPSKDATDAACYCKDKLGFMLFGGHQGGRSLHPGKKSSLPVFKIKSYAAFATEVEVTRVEFKDFASATACGKAQHVFERNPFAADYIPMHRFNKAHFENVEEAALAWIEKPNPNWAAVDPLVTPSNCGDWPCTAPENVVLKFDDTTYAAGGLAADPSFQLVSGNEPAANSFNSCVAKPAWRAFRCHSTGSKLGVLLFESLDVDKEDREVQPVEIQSPTSGYANSLNSFMDHGWDGRYTSQKRLQRFPAMVEVGTDYTVRMTGTPPRQMRFALRSDSEQGGIKVKIPYTTANTYTVKADGVVVDSNPFDDAAGKPTELKKVKCGENRYVGRANFLEFYIKPGCTITIKPRDAIVGTVRMDWDMATFWKSGGTSAFVDRVASLLGVPPSRIYTIQLYTGSVILKFAVTEPSDEQEGQQGTGGQSGSSQAWNRDETLSTLTAAMTDEAAGEALCGAPVLGFEEDGRLVAGDDIPDPPAEEDLLDEFFDNDTYDPNKRLIGGGEGDDDLAGYDGEANALVGFGGDDELTGKDKGDDIIGGAGQDVLKGNGGNDRISGGDDRDRIWGGDGSDAIHGGAGDDTIKGGAGHDKVQGGDGADKIYGEDGNDELEGGAQNDRLYGQAGDDTIAGGEGADKLYGGDGKDEITGDAGNDHIEGGAGEGVLSGGDGDDTIRGGDEVDTISGGADNDRIEAYGGDDIISAGDGKDRVYAGAGEDQITGEGGNDTIDGGEGNDTISGGAGRDTLFGGDGVDTISGGTEDDRLYGGEGDDELTGGDGNDEINGDGGADTISGGAGDDTLRGGAGADVLDGGSGVNNLEGGDGNDRLTGGDEKDTLKGGAGDDTLLGGGGDDRLVGGDGDDTLTGGAGSNTIEGNAGKDTITGGEGEDVLKGGIDDDDLKGFEGADRLWGEAGNDVIDAGTGADTVYAGSGDDTVTGGTGDDYIDGSTGQDTIYGGEGDDELIGYHGDDTIEGGIGADEIHGGNDNDVLSGGEGADYISGGEGDDEITGGTGADDLRGGGGVDTILGGTGDDHLRGGDGNDVLTDTEGSNWFDGEGGDDVITAGDLADVLRGGSGADTLHAGAGDDVLYGGDGDDTLIGGAGSNTLQGGSGNDYMTGGELHDSMRGGEDDDHIIGYGGADTIYGEHGNDTIDGGEGADFIKGGEGDDTIEGGAGDDRIYGEAGDDTIDGGAGSDTLNGGAGRDTLIAGEGSLHKFYLWDGGDDIKAGDGVNKFYFYGVSTNGATTIDKLNMGDELRFRNACGKWKRVRVERDIANKLDIADLTGPWTVTLSAEGVAEICKQGTTTCRSVQTPACN